MQAVFTRRDDAALAKRSLPLAAAPDFATAPAPKPQVRISTEAFEAARSLAPGWDRYALESLYLDWARTKDAARSEDARFLGWVKSYTKGKPAP
jgi:hypothetical protein